MREAGVLDTTELARTDFVPQARNIRRLSIAASLTVGVPDVTMKYVELQCGKRVLHSVSTTQGGGARNPRRVSLLLLLLLLTHTYTPRHPPPPPTPHTHTHTYVTAN